METVGSKDGISCMWGNSARNLKEFALPKTANQFRFDRSLLPGLYDELDNLGGL